MRVYRSFSALTLLASLLATACGGSTPGAAAPPEPAPPEPKVQADEPSTPSKTGAGEDDAWVGEKPAKGGESEQASDKVEPAPADGKPVETRTMDVIRKLVMDNRKAARKCYEDARRDNKDLQGDVVIHFVLDPEGKVKKAELNQERSTLKAPAVADCVIAVIKSIPFPKSSRAMETTTNYPFNFTP